MKLFSSIVESEKVSSEGLASHLLLTCGQFGMEWLYIDIIKFTMQIDHFNPESQRKKNSTPIEPRPNNINISSRKDRGEASARAEHI